MCGGGGVIKTKGEGCELGILLRVNAIVDAQVSGTHQVSRPLRFSSHVSR